MIKENEQKLTIVLFITSVVIFSYGVYIDNINSIILHLLEFIVIFEIVRAFIHYLKDGRFKVRYMIDGSIFYTIKELYIGFVDFKLSNDSGLINLSIKVLIVLMILRVINNITNYYFDKKEIYED